MSAGGARLAGSSGRVPGGHAPLALSVPAVAVALVASTPLLYLFVRASSAGLGQYLARVADAYVLSLVLRTVALAAGTVTLAAVIAVAAAWLVTRTDLPGRRWWAVAAALPLVFPSYIAAYASVAVFGPRGALALALSPLGVDRLPEIAYGYSGALAVLALFTYPYIYLPVAAVLVRLDPALEEGSRSLGVGRWATFFRVVLPQLRRSLHAGSLLVALYVLSDFGAVSIARYDTFTLAIYNAYRALFDRATAASLATVLVVLTLALLALEGFLSRRARRPATSAARPPRPVPLGRWRWPALLGMSLLSLLTLGVPIAVVGFWGLRGLWAGKSIGMAWSAATGSLAVSMAAAVVAVVLALPLASWAERYPGRMARLAERLATTGYALPGLVVALSLVFLATRSIPALYQSLALLVTAYVIRFLPQALAAIRAALAGVPPALEEAARGLGARPLAALRDVTLPLARPGIAAGGALVFLTAMKELPATLLLRPIGFETLATRVWTAAADGVYSEAALPALVLVLASGPPIYWLVIRPSLAGVASTAPAEGKP